MSKGSIGNPEYEVFLSYCREDKHKARHVFEALGRQGWSVFMDQEIPNAERWEQHLQNQLGRVPCVLVLWSSAAGPSVWVRREAQVGADRGVLVHATLDGTEPPATFSQLQATDLSTWDGGSIDADFLRLVSAIAMKVGTAGALGTLREPAPLEKITDDHIALASTSWRHHKKSDRRYVLYPFQIHLRLVGTEIALRRVENVIYYFDPAYAENRPDLVDPVRVCQRCSACRRTKPCS